MALRAYAFRIGKDAFLLDRDEWGRIEPYLEDRNQKVLAFRRAMGCTHEEALQYEPDGQAALEVYEDLTGMRLDHPMLLRAVRMDRYGMLCPCCRKPFRTPRARLCVECGFNLPKGMRAGRLNETMH
jgi:hypothetical protein